VAVKQVRVSDLSGRQASEDELAKLIVHQRPHTRGALGGGLGQAAQEAANVHDQDYVVVYSCPLRDLNTGDMVVASRVQGDIAEVTLKLWRRTSSGIELHPASAGGVNSQGRPHSVQEYQSDVVASALKVRWIICNHPRQPALSV
jgi:hypothetical protein